MKLYSCLAGSLLSFQFITAQPKATLTIGDTLPGSMFRYIQNYPALKTAVPNLSGKWIILDFMSTGCGSCIQIIPRLDSLQKKYERQIQIVLVTGQNAVKVNSFAQRNPTVKKSILPILAEDSSLTPLFPFLWISHEVWIDPDRVVRAITYPEYVNDRNIDWAISGKKFKLPLKADVEKEEYNGRKPFVSPQPGFFYSAILPLSDRLTSQSRPHLDTAAAQVRLSMLNASVIDMYRYSTGNPVHNISQIVLNVADTLSLVYNAEAAYRVEWEKKHLYCYEATFPIGTSMEQIRKKLQLDLDQWFKLNSSFEKRLVDCYVLKEPNVAILNLAGNNISTEDRLSINGMFDDLAEKYFSVPAIDERRNKIKLVTNIPRSALADMNELKKRLAPYGLDMIKEQRELPILTLSDITGSVQ